MSHMMCIWNQATNMLCCGALNFFVLFFDVGSKQPFDSLLLNKFYILYINIPKDIIKLVL